MSFQFTNNNNNNNKDKTPQFLEGSLKDFNNLNSNKFTNEIGPKDQIFNNNNNNNLFYDKQNKTNMPPIGARFEPIQPINNKTNNSFLNHHRIYKDLHDKNL